MSDEFIMYVLVPAVLLVISYPVSKWMNRNER